MTNVTLDEMLGFISLKVFCAEDAHRNLALRVLARDMVLQANLYTTELCRKAAKHTKYFGPAGNVMLTGLRDWFGEETPRCWVKLAEVFEGSVYFTVLDVDRLAYMNPWSQDPVSTPAVRLSVGLLIQEAMRARAAA